MIIFLVSYRARGNQAFRKDQLRTMINNINTYFTKNSVEYKIIICEQNDDKLFNRGKLLNVAFIESEKLFNFKKLYFHINIDYYFNLNIPFPNEIKNFTNGFLDLYKFPFPILGSACLFDGESYKVINGFPNDICGWGGDDWAIYNRIIHKKLQIIYPKNIIDLGFIIEDSYDKTIETDRSHNSKNIELARRADLDTNGLNSCIYTIANNGEFHNEKNIYHFLLNI
jgi:hypothetical protein